jgi:adenylate cyclase class 2
MSHGTHETEIKLQVTDAAAGRRLLGAAGFRVSKRRLLETNTVLDTPGCALRKRSALLRVRRAGGIATVTYKGPPEPSKHKSREELEFDLPDARAIVAILDRLGFQPVWRYEKYRTEFREPGSRGVATLDETPAGVFLELEGTPRWIDRTARKLGFGEGDYITASYGQIYLDRCARDGVQPGDMVFAR